MTQDGYFTLDSASFYRCYDMSGNVYEWCSDYSTEWPKPYASENAANPTGPDSGEWRIIRGGAWNSGWESLRSAHRYTEEPYHRGTVGIRVARF